MGWSKAVLPAVLLAGAAALAILGSRRRKKRITKYYTQYSGRPDDSFHVLAGGLLHSQHHIATSEQRAAARGRPSRARLEARLTRLQGEVADVMDSVTRALRRTTGAALRRQMHWAEGELRLLLGQLAELPVDANQRVADLRTKRDACVAGIREEIVELRYFQQKAALEEAAAERLNALLDGLCERHPEFQCPVMHDVMRRPVRVLHAHTSGGSTRPRYYDAEVLRHVRAQAAAHSMPPVEPLTNIPLHRCEMLPDDELRARIRLAVTDAIARHPGSAEQRRDMMKVWVGQLRRSEGPWQ